jgi:hypothetical protein
MDNYFRKLRATSYEQRVALPCAQVFGLVGLQPGYEPSRVYPLAELCRLVWLLPNS